MLLSAQDANKGAALLAEVRAAVGGAARLDAVKSLDVRGEFRRMAGQNTISGELQVRIERPGKFRRDEDLTLPGGGPAVVRTEVLNGTDVWDENSGGPGFGGRILIGPGGGRGGGAPGTGAGRGDGQGRRRAALDPAQLAERQRRARQADLARLLLAWLLTTDAAVTWAGTAESPDGRADVLEIATTPPTRLFVDESSHLPLMLTWQGPGPLFIRGRGPGGARGGPPDGAPADRPAEPDNAPPAAPRPREATLRMTLGEYMEVAGIQLPHFITRAVNGQTIEEWTIERYRINPSFRDSVFTR